MTVVIKVDPASDELVAGVRRHKQQRAEQLRDSMPGKASQIDAESVDTEDVRTFTRSLVVDALDEHGIDVDEDDVTVVSA